jgi:hypothetical protein
VRPVEAGLVCERFLADSERLASPSDEGTELLLKSVHVCAQGFE